MESPLSAGICLRQRYLIQRLLGQGRWGYTYLALDQERFGECCVLRQFQLPKIENPKRLEEIKIYFQQEVSRLYQLQHPCIPRFWATFMEAQGLFIVQEFIAGFSCRQLLLSRRQHQQTVSEREVRFLLTTLLPCLDLLHQHHLSQGTIAPDALVLKVPAMPIPVPDLDLAIPKLENLPDITQTQPLLVTFGSFPAGLLRRLSASDGAADDLDIRYLRQTLLPIGRMGFIPPEQVHAIEAHPHGDLYALAATCLVLLTGQDPEQLFDQATLTWNWPREQVSPDLAAVLGRMLAWQPVDRYQSASAVLADLSRSVPASAFPPGSQGEGSTPPPFPIPTTGPMVAAPLPSSLPSPAAAAPQSAGNPLAPRPVPPVIAPSAPVLTETPLTPLPSMAGASHADASVTLVYEPVLPSKHRQRRRWRSLYNRLHPYLRSGLILGLGLIGVLGLVWSRDRLLPSRTVSTRESHSLLSDSLSSDPSASLNRSIPWPPSPYTYRSRSSPLPPLSLPNDPSLATGGELSEGTPGGLARSLRFAPGEVSTLVRGNLGRASSQQYVLEALQGQVLAVQLVGAGVVMNLLRSNGQAIDAAAYRTQRWTGQLPGDDRYQIEVSGYGAYTLEVALSPATAQFPPAETGWIRFAPGETSTTVTGEVAPGQVQRYLLAAQAQQLLVVQVLQGTIAVKTIAPNGQRLGVIAANSKTWQTRLPQAGDYLIEVSAPQASRFALRLEVY
ncbi:hypothetical protein OOK60_18345 [Trichothermofontia sichuanensis B231]|uniref:protein kinase domain-containing protein n=1 Tax=Trichothermofontia sichuanensis TaxID=3045816 RepID=UPI0022453472|nr:hypothetical protein [Trichothermofontia sichuanensis]UZQ54404.1 hypothetical protein OOK60_18345 [Trichothermofontia sichuanensis B231]